MEDRDDAKSLILAKPGRRSTTGASNKLRNLLREVVVLCRGVLREVTRGMRASIKHFWRVNCRVRRGDSSNRVITGQQWNQLQASFLAAVNCERLPRAQGLALATFRLARAAASCNNTRQAEQPVIFFVPKPFTIPAERRPGACSSCPSLPSSQDQDTGAAFDLHFASNGQDVVHHPSPLSLPDPNAAEVISGSKCQSCSPRAVAQFGSNTSSRQPRRTWPIALSP